MFVPHRYIYLLNFNLLIVLVYDTIDYGVGLSERQFLDPLELKIIALSLAYLGNAMHRLFYLWHNVKLFPYYILTMYVRFYLSTHYYVYV